MGRDDRRLVIYALCGISLSLAAALLLGQHIEPHGSLAVWSTDLARQYWPHIVQSVKWGDMPTWGLLVGAIFTAWYARKAFKAQSKELAELQAEGAEQRKVNEKHVAVLELSAATFGN